MKFDTFQVKFLAVNITYLRCSIHQKKVHQRGLCQERKVKLRLTKEQDLWGILADRDGLRPTVSGWGWPRPRRSWWCPPTLFRFDRKSCPLINEWCLPLSSLSWFHVTTILALWDPSDVWRTPDWRSWGAFLRPHLPRPLVYWPYFWLARLGPLRCNLGKRRLFLCHWELWLLMKILQGCRNLLEATVLCQEGQQKFEAELRAGCVLKLLKKGQSFNVIFLLPHHSLEV